MAVYTVYQDGSGYVCMYILCVCVCLGGWASERHPLTAGIYWFWSSLWVTTGHTDRTEGVTGLKPPTNLLTELSPAKGAYKATVYPRGLPQMYIKLHTHTDTHTLMSLALVIAGCDIIYLSNFAKTLNVWDKN